MAEPDADNSVQPDLEFVVATLQEELNQANANRIYLLSVIKQMTKEFKDAQELWALERESLTKAHGD